MVSDCLLNLLLLLVSQPHFWHSEVLIARKGHLNFNHHVFEWSTPESFLRTHASKKANCLGGKLNKKMEQKRGVSPSFD